MDYWSYGPSSSDIAINQNAAQTAIDEASKARGLWQEQKQQAQQEAQNLFGGSQMLGEQYQQALNERKKRLERGLSEQEANAIKQSGLANLTQLQASQGRSGVKGGAALAQQQGVMRQSANSLANAQAQAKERALSDYEQDIGKRIYGIQGAGTAAQQLAAQQYASDRGVSIASQPAPTPSTGLLGGTVLCTLAFNKGSIPCDVYHKDCEYGKTLSSNTINGYHYWAIPFAKFLSKNEIFYKMICPFIKKWSWHIYGKKNAFGYVCKIIGIPLCNIIGRILK